MKMNLNNALRSALLEIEGESFARHTHISDRSNRVVRLCGAHSFWNTHRRSPAPASTDRRNCYRHRSPGGSALDSGAPSLRARSRDRGPSFRIVGNGRWNFHDCCRRGAQVGAGCSFSHLYGDRSRCRFNSCDEGIAAGNRERLGSYVRSPPRMKYQLLHAPV